jgi:hypothetical protein
MAAERVVRRPVVTARCVAIAYVLASLVAAFSFWPLIQTMRGDALGLVIGYCLLGPLSTLVHALYGHGDTLVGLTFYAVETGLLAGSLLLWTLRNRPARWFGYLAAVVMWLGSGYVMAWAWYFSA